MADLNKTTANIIIYPGIFSTDNSSDAIIPIKYGTSVVSNTIGYEIVGLENEDSKTLAQLHSSTANTLIIPSEFKMWREYTVSDPKKKIDNSYIRYGYNEVPNVNDDKGKPIYISGLHGTTTHMATKHNNCEEFVSLESVSSKILENCLSVVRISSIAGKNSVENVRSE